MSLTSQLLRLQQAIYKATDGRIGHKMLGVPTLLLGTTGRRSGQPRTNALVYARDGDDYLVVPSNGGRDKPPGWLYNLQANPAVQLQVGRDRRAGTASVIAPSDPDYERLWRIVNDNNRDRYTAYQHQTRRPIPVIAIAPSQTPV
jgi:deazaflavin-dependent oxidoreductase (nitroreductase family)